jgi:hypothetical protein
MYRFRPRRHPDGRGVRARPIGGSMKNLRLRRPSPALVVSVVALSVALGGTGYAAVVLPANSVGAKQIKTNAVTGAKIKKNAVTAAKVKNASLLAADFKAGQLPAGPVGATGPRGPEGPRGATGPKGDTGTVDTSNFYDKAQSDARYLATTGTAANAALLDGVDSTGFVQGPGSPNMWSYRRDWARNAAVNNLPSIPGLGQLSFICQPPNTTGPGQLTFQNTSGGTVESFATITMAAGSTLSQLTTAPGATTTLNLGSGASQVVWQIGHQTYFAPGPLATVTASHVTDVTQCRISAMAHYQDPTRG